MIKVIKYNEQYNDINSYELKVSIKNGIISVTTIYPDEKNTTITLNDEPFSSYNKYVIYEENGYVGIINSTIYSSFKKLRISHLTKLTGMVDLYTIVVCDATDSDKNIVFIPGSKKIKNITVTSDVEVQEQIVSSEDEWEKPHAERLSAIAERSYEREREIAPSPFSIHKMLEENTPVKAPKKEKVQPKKKTAAKNTAAAKTVKKTTAKETSETLRDEVRIVFKKALTDREQKVFDHFAANKGKIVYAKDLAALLDLPRDYVYKYIKNLRAKIEGDKLENADKGGFILN